MAANDLTVGVPALNIVLIYQSFDEMQAGLDAHDIFLPTLNAALNEADPGQTL